MARWEGQVEGAGDEARVMGIVCPLSLNLCHEGDSQEENGGGGLPREQRLSGARVALAQASLPAGWTLGSWH